MNITSTPFSDLPFSRLFQDYTSNFSRLADFFDTNPFSELETEKKINTYSFQGNRKESVGFLTEFNRLFDAQDEVYQSIKKLEDESSCTVVTGQQLTAYGGPLFTILKIITTIHYASIWEKKYGRPFIPVFWLADEDHDFEEAATIGLPEGDDLKKLSVGADHSNYPRVSEIMLGDSFEIFRDKVKGYLTQTDFSSQLWDILDDSYQEGATYSEAFGKLILKMFGKFGLVLAGTNTNSSKKILLEPLCLSIEKSSEAFEALNKKSRELEDQGYHKQVHVQSSNLFWIDDHGNREKITHSNLSWYIEGKEISWTDTELTHSIQQNPNRFSPNVFLRPITQNYLLPCIAYVAGPSELAYYGQMKEFYRVFNLDMPTLIPRYSATIIESGIERIIDKLPFENHQYNQRIEDLESAYIAKADTPDIESIYKNWKKSAEQCSVESKKAISKIDPTLEGSVERVINIFFNELDKLKGKTYRSVKEQEKTQIQRLRRIQSSLYPNGNLQEREVAFIYFMNKYGFDIWSDILAELSEHTPQSHKWIHL